METTGQHLPPSPEKNFFGGHLFSMRRDPLRFTTGNMRRYGGLVQLQFARFTAYQVTDPDLIQQVLTKDNRIWHKSVLYKVILADYLGDGLLTSDGDFWRRQRKLIQPAFHTVRINTYADIMVEFAQKMLIDWENEQVRDIAAEMMRLTLFIVGKTLFDADMVRSSDKVADAATHMLHDIIAESRSVVRLPAWIPTPLRRRKKQTIQHLNEIVMPIIEARRQSGEDKGDLLSMLLLAKDDNGEGMTDEQVRNEALTLVLAGHETTANALTWTLYLLSQNPDVEARLHDEIDRVLDGRLPTLDDLKYLPYTEMVLKEGMRVYPPVWSIGRQTDEDTELDGYPIPRKSLALIPMWAVQRNEEYYPDPERFDPERFSPENEAKLHKYAYLPFGGGPRICIGNSFAMMEARLILASIMQRYHLSLVPGQQIEPEPLLTLRPKNGIKMRLHARERIAGPAGD
jgi:cytochrome P450